MDIPEVWTSIITNGGSVQHLDFINDSIKEVFKTDNRDRPERDNKTRW